MVLGFILTIATLRGTSCDLIDVLNIGNNFDLNSVLNVFFNGSDDGLVLTGEVTAPIDEEVTFWCTSE